MTTISIQVDLPPDVTITAYQRHAQGHGFEVSWPLPQRCQCDYCHRDEPAAIEFKDAVQVVRDLDILAEPTFWIYHPAYHRCPWCNHRQFLIPPFKRKEVAYTYRFERQVLRLLIGSTEEEVARRLGISAEMVDLIVHHQLTDARAKQVDPARVITDVGIDELSLKKRHKLYATILTDLTNPEQPEVLAVATGKDEAAARECLEKLGAAQRQQVRTYRADMSAAYHTVCRALLKNARAVVDRFHVAKKFNEAIDGQRKKNHAGVQGEALESGTEGVSRPDVGVSPRPEGSQPGGKAAAGGVVREAAPTADLAGAADQVSENLRYDAESAASIAGLGEVVLGHAEGLSGAGRLHPNI
jgi:transposase